MLLEIDNIALRFSNKPILTGIYLRAETGKITGILGCNGCGKTSLLSIIFGNLRSESKLVRIDNKPYLRPLFRSGKVQYLPQHPFIPNHLTIRTVFKLYKVSWTAFLADFKNFAAYEKYTVKELSGGERRVIEAYLIIRGKAEIILLDEPLTHLAPIYIEKFIKIMRQEAGSKAMIITDHLFQYVIDLADDLYFLGNGCTQQITDPKQLENLDYLNAGTLDKL